MREMARVGAFVFYSILAKRGKWRSAAPAERQTIREMWQDATISSADHPWHVKDDHAIWQTSGIPLRAAPIAGFLFREGI